MKASFTKEKETKNTIRFTENTEGQSETVLGTVYVPKSSLKEIGWSEGKNLVIELSVE